MTPDSLDPRSIDAVPFRGIVEQSVAGIYILQDEQFQYSNATFAGMGGYSHDEMTGRMLRECVPDSYEQEVMDRYQRRISGEVRSMRFITQGLHREGHVVHIEVHGEARTYQGRPAIVGVGVDVSAQIRRDAELEQSRHQYRELASQLNTIREQQRAEYAREVHDVLGGLLTSMKLDVGRISRRTRSRSIRGIATDLNALLVEAIDNVRELSESMRPQLLDHLGLHAAMVSHLGRFKERLGLKVSMEPAELDFDLCRWRSIAVYRIFQEALTNVARHARATAVRVRLRRIGDEFLLEIEDNGRGMAPAQDDDAQAVAPRFSLGLISMRERAHEIGGVLVIDSAPGCGTRVTLRAPVVDNPLVRHA